MRTVERGKTTGRIQFMYVFVCFLTIISFNLLIEVRHIENEIRKEYPGAAFIELEPDSKDSNRFAIDDGVEAALKRIEIESLNRMLKILFVEPGNKPGDKPK